MDERGIHAPCNWLTQIGDPSDGVVFVHHTFLLEAVAKKYRSPTTCERWTTESARKIYSNSTVIRLINRVGISPTRPAEHAVDRGRRCCKFQSPSNDDTDGNLFESTEPRWMEHISKLWNVRYNPVIGRGLASRLPV
jgi:hypothetical protein